MIYILYNPLANNKRGAEANSELEKLFKEKEGKDALFLDVRKISGFNEFVRNLSGEDEVVISGGDGTLNHFINDVSDLNISQKIYLFPDGSGNDFERDVKDFLLNTSRGKTDSCAKDSCSDDSEKKSSETSESSEIEDKLIPLNEFLKNLPEVSVNGMKRRFINGIGYGIDGYCCEVGDELREKSDKPVNYALIAIKGLLGKFKPSNAVVTVDGKSMSFKSVWLAPAMLGRFYGGGMMVAPFQDRLNKERTLTSVVWHSKSKLKTLLAFPSIFKGEHIKKTKMIEMFSGHEIKVEFDKPQALQIDGETVKNVLTYTATFY